MSILKYAGRQETNIKEFIENSASDRGIKYSAVPNAKHCIYIPTKKVIINENGEDREVESLISYSMHVHELRLPNNKYKAVPCLSGIVIDGQDGTVINDGTCPFCDRINDAWDIVNYRKALEEESCKLVGDERETYLKEVNKNILNDIKVQNKTPFLYLLIYVYNTDSKGNAVISEVTGLPEYTAKIWRLRRSSIEKIQEQLDNAGVTLGGGEIAIKYPDTKDPRLLATQRTTSPIFENKTFINKYPGLKEAMQEEAERFNWEGVEKSFAEFEDFPTSAATKLANSMFKDWDAYQEKVKTDPNALYLEYRKNASNVPTSTTQAVQTSQALQLPNNGQPMQTPGAMDANTLFSGANNSLGI